MADDYDRAAFYLRGGLPKQCDFCQQPYVQGARWPCPEECGEWSCNECYARWSHGLTKPPH